MVRRRSGKRLGGNGDLLVDTTYRMVRYTGKLDRARYPYGGGGGSYVRARAR